MKIVIADSNALLMPFKNSINIDSELAGILGSYKIMVPAPIIGELKKLSDKIPEAKIALKLAMTKELVETETMGDASVIEAAVKMDGIVLTNDRELIGIALKQRIPVIRMMGKKRLVLTDHKNR